MSGQWLTTSTTADGVWDRQNRHKGISPRSSSDGFGKERYPMNKGSSRTLSYLFELLGQRVRRDSIRLADRADARLQRCHRHDPMRSGSWRCITQGLVSVSIGSGREQKLTGPIALSIRASGPNRRAMGCLQRRSERWWPRHSLLTGNFLNSMDRFMLKDQSY